MNKYQWRSATGASRCSPHEVTKKTARKGSCCERRVARLLWDRKKLAVSTDLRNICSLIIGVRRSRHRSYEDVVLKTDLIVQMKGLVENMVEVEVQIKYSEQAVISFQALNQEQHKVVVSASPFVPGDVLLERLLTLIFQVWKKKVGLITHVA